MSSPSATSPDKPPPLSRGFQFTIRQMMLLVAFSAITCLGLLPAIRESWKYPAAAVLFEAIILPLLWAIFVLCCVRTGPLQLWLLRGILLLPILIGALLALAISFVPFYYVRNDPIGISFVLIIVGIVDSLIVARIRRWVNHLVPMRCPSCHSRSLISDTGSSRPILRGLKATRWCWSCRKRFGRPPGGDWTANEG